MSLLPRLFLAALALATAGCAQDPYNHMTPLEDSGEAPNHYNRFPIERGGFGTSRADDPEDEPLPIERLRQN